MATQVTFPRALFAGLFVDSLELIEHTRTVPELDAVRAVLMSIGGGATEHFKPHAWAVIDLLSSCDFGHLPDLAKVLTRILAARKRYKPAADIRDIRHLIKIKGSPK